MPFKQEISPPLSCQTQDNKPTSSLPIGLVLKGLNSEVGREQKDTDVEYEKRLMREAGFFLPRSYRSSGGLLEQPSSY